MFIFINIDINVNVKKTKIAKMSENTAPSTCVFTSTSYLSITSYFLSSSLNVFKYIHIK